ncbi:MAG: response regulator [Pirellulaceae bacterium]
MRILIVDDLADAAESLALLLRMLKYEVRTANSGPQALALASQFQPQAVLLDLGLPAMDGCEVARRLRANPVTQNMFIVALSGYGHAAHRKLAAEAGCDEYLVKPVELAALRTLLGRI